MNNICRCDSILLSARRVFGSVTRSLLAKSCFFLVAARGSTSVTTRRCFAISTLVATLLTGVASAQIGDVNLDGVLNSLDVNLLTAEIAAGTNNFDYDVNSDGLVNLVDLDLWFPLYSTESGVPLAVALVDVNFDAFNTVADYQILLSNLSVSTTNFTDGNLNADSLVNLADRDLYLSRGGVVPEPGSLVLALAAVTGSLRRRRRS